MPAADVFSATSYASLRLYLDEMDKLHPVTVPVQDLSLAMVATVVYARSPDKAYPDNCPPMPPVLLRWAEQLTYGNQGARETAADELSNAILALCPDPDPRYTRTPDLDSPTDRWTRLSTPSYVVDVAHLQGGRVLGGLLASGRALAAEITRRTDVKIAEAKLANPGEYVVNGVRPFFGAHVRIDAFMLTASAWVILAGRLERKE